MFARIALVLALLSPSLAFADDAALVEAGSGSAAPAQHACTLDGKEIDCSQLGDHPVESASEVTRLWKDGAIVPAVILGLFLLLGWASKHIEWLETGKRAAYTASGLAALTLLAEPASRGTTPTASMIIGALGAAALLFMNASKKSKQA